MFGLASLFLRTLLLVITPLVLEEQHQEGIVFSHIGQ
jgi:hypothetical protein